MYWDFSSVADSTFEADICVIGTGAAGFACALTLLDSGLRVLLVESGVQVHHAAIADLHRGEVSNQPHTGIHEGRVRIIGGTTTKWGGQALPFMAEDFRPRAHVKDSGWPIDEQDLAPYYQKAEQVLGTDQLLRFGYRPWKDWAVEEPKFSPKVFDLLVTKWCKIPNFAQQHGDKIKQSTRVNLLSNANVVELVPAADSSRVHLLRIRSISGKTGTIQASYVIAAGGAIETIRLFLNSRKFGSHGLGNEYGLVGRYFQDHVAAVIGQIVPTSRKRMHDVFDPFYKDGFKYLPRIRFSPALAQELEVLHASTQIVFTNEDNSPLSLAKELVADLRHRRSYGAKKLKLLVNPRFLLDVSKAALRWKVGKRGSSAAVGPIWLEVHSEQDPIAESYISLSDSTDSMQVPRVKLNWTVSDLTIKTIRTVAQLLKKEFEEADLGEVVLAPWIADETANSRRWLADTSHQAGGLRMARHEPQGVVDAACKVFGVDNLYVASSAVFPTSSFSNPTMTIIALAIRISEEIMHRMQAAPSAALEEKISR